MDRRQYITLIGVTGTTALSGCSAIPGVRDSDPEYTDVTVEDLMLPKSVFPSDWTRNDTINENENFDGIFVNSDETTIVAVGINIHDTIDEAKEDYEQSVNNAGEIYELDIGNEAFWVEREQFAVTLFRDSNVEAQVVSGRQSGLEFIPGISRSQEYARELYDYMQSV